VGARSYTGLDHPTLGESEPGCTTHPAMSLEPSAGARQAGRVAGRRVAHHETDRAGSAARYTASGMAACVENVVVLRPVGKGLLNQPN
jgi:hypothetical protein